MLIYENQNIKNVQTKNLTIDAVKNPRKHLWQILKVVTQDQLRNNDECSFINWESRKLYSFILKLLAFLLQQASVKTPIKIALNKIKTI